ncbi:hypothetical protein Kpho02_59690 [Kitasatospora phosalacinea]|uniref:Uncharacterized protein n=1 Tax=Kitasatospora phosalacinea TaxID=2065 RepID=A0A9W6V610_9ACTN|nr:hypothetical protein [Kitasatospora phosalacinea]GLW73670.1 hypothetical protein Kpho02_59690 [Kitasatospora phosalacinea]
MRQSLLRLLPDRLARRFGYEMALHDPAAVAAEIETSLADARAHHEAELRAALSKLTGPLECQPGLLDLHREAADIVVYLAGVGAAAENNLDRTDPGQEELYWAVLDALTAAEALRERTAAAALLALPAQSAASLQHS